MNSDQLGGTAEEADPEMTQSPCPLSAFDISKNAKSYWWTLTVAFGDVRQTHKSFLFSSTPLCFLIHRVYL